MEKQVSTLISETQEKIIEALNESHLHPSILILILQNIMGQLQALSAQMERGESNADNNP